MLMDLVAKLYYTIYYTIGPVGTIFVVLLVVVVTTAIITAVLLGVRELKHYSDYKNYESEKERDMRTMSVHDWTQKYWSIDD